MTLWSLVAADSRLAPVWAWRPPRSASPRGNGVDFFAGLAGQPPHRRTATVPVIRRAAPSELRIHEVPGGSPGRTGSRHHELQVARSVPRRRRPARAGIGPAVSTAPAGERCLRQPARTRPRWVRLSVTPARALPGRGASVSTCGPADGASDRPGHRADHGPPGQRPLGTPRRARVSPGPGLDRGRPAPAQTPPGGPTAGTSPRLPVGRPGRSDGVARRRHVTKSSLPRAG